MNLYHASVTEDVPAKRCRKRSQRLFLVHANSKDDAVKRLAEDTYGFRGKLTGPRSIVTSDGTSWHILISTTTGCIFSQGSFMVDKGWVCPPEKDDDE